MTLALDIVHDFFIEVWPGLTKRFDPKAGSMDAYVTGAFVYFARGRALAETRWSRLFDDLKDAESIASEPSELPERTVQQVSAALSRLNLEQRALLLARFGDARQTEQELASRYGITRYEVRSRLLAALAKLGSELGVFDAEDSFDGQVAKLLFVDGRSVASTAATLGTTMTRVRIARDRILRSLGTRSRQ